MANFVVGPFVEKFMEKIIDIFSHYMQGQFKWQTGMKLELKRLRENCPKIQVVVSTAMQAQTIDQNSPLNKWIWQLRDVIDEADDLLDDLENKEHQQHGYLQNLIEVGNRALEIDPELKRLVEAMHKLDRISADVSNFLHILPRPMQEQWEQEVELRINRENDLIGRRKEKEFVLRWLRNPSDETTTDLYNNISLLSIVGHGGVGKTTLVQHVYNNEITKEFDLKMWVCVSYNFDVKKVIADMLESLKKKRPSVETLDALQRNLMSQVMSKKFLLVLDDLWDREEEDVLLIKWGTVFSALSCGGLGCKILITTRKNYVASMIAKVIKKEKEALGLEGLKEDECLQLLTTYAFPVEENPNDHKKLKFIAKELVKKLYGSPLAAKVMGGILSSNLEERYWRNVLNSSLAQNDVYSILKLSYIFLPENLQSCFSFCSIFPEDHLFDKNDLVRMWIAVGFIRPSYIQAETLEDIGERYFDTLIKKSFFDKAFGVVDTRNYKMHDLLHELAESVSNQECFRFVGDEEVLLQDYPKTIRHLSVETSNPEVLKKLERFKKLRTLHITINGDYHSNLFCGLSVFFHSTKSFRVLHSNSLSSKAILEEIEYLHHLRYFWFDCGNVKLLDWSARDIADPDLDHNYLKTLNIISYMGVRSAMWMNEANLLNLEAIYLKECLEWEILPPFGQLPFLKALSIGNMPKAKWLEKKFYGNDMCCVFPSLQRLSFWKLEALVDWFDPTVVDGLFPCLTNLSLSNCPYLKELRSLPPKLESLTIKNIGWKALNCLKSITLKTLEVHHCPNITSISLADEIDKFRMLKVEDCPSLQSLFFDKHHFN